ncbi:hypothetical protein [Novosphingopyxis sp. YJ-S2-01]|uniref:hypothetical protein n=1 Tax=Novosphingopyxis sp. YJ-S2-01 TaxID=2794021 RepID=UPI0018DAF990|nr:hypothetical protein [Novosphingopyxis sp. YJ-S2-01]MBH9537703.1 hypothetical protein [Novosphingopyxis sp. YJ-S2-01]
MSARNPFGPAMSLRAAALVLIMSIFAHSLIPEGSVTDRDSGSAFNAFTIDVSLGPTRASDVAMVHTVERAPDPVAGGNSAAIVRGSLSRTPALPASADKSAAPRKQRQALSPVAALPPPSRAPPFA